MSEVVIRARDLRKVYRLYSGPGYRFLDMFGLLGNRPGAYTEHSALDGVSLEIRRGEKVAFIGRNGAGKSTLLKLITSVIEPTSGTLEVTGKAHALLQIGTGFHPDFTGRENVFAYLAQLGVTGTDAERRYHEIVEFAELEEYIGQPVKTYSSGMAVRLMFSTATAITPELLVLDEVLGVGDAYFAQKSYERMRELTEGAGTTLLLVTHDIYSAVKICERIIWIDRGRVLMDGDGPVVIKAYEDSIRQQEEVRLRLRKQQRLEANRASAAEYALIEIQSVGNTALAAPVFFGRIEVSVGDRMVLLPFDEAAFDEKRPAHLQLEGSAWSAITDVGGRAARGMQNYGSPFHKVVAVVPVAPQDGTPLRVDLDYHSAAPFQAVVRMFVGEQVFDVGVIDGEADGWQRWSAETGGPRQGAAASEVNASGVYGTGAIGILEIRTVDASGNETHFFEHGKPFQLRLRYHVRQPDLRERPQVLIAFHRDGVQDVFRVITRDLFIDGTDARDGEIVLNIPALPLGVGTYTVTVMVVREGYYDETQTIFFSLNPGVYASHSRALEMVVTGGGIVGSGTAVVGQGEWSLSK